MDDWHNMDSADAVQLLEDLKRAAVDRNLWLNRDMRETVALLHGFGGYHSRLGTESHVHVFPAAAQAHLLVSGRGSPAFEDTTYRRVIEHCDLAIENISSDPDFQDARVAM
jgi:hypothetical protein